MLSGGGKAMEQLVGAASGRGHQATETEPNLRKTKGKPKGNLRKIKLSEGDEAME